MEMFRWTFDPMEGLRQLRTEMEDAFGRLNRSFGFRKLTPPVNVLEDGDGVTVVAEAPGVRPEDLTIEVEADSLRLTMKRPEPEGVKDEQFHRRERATGEFTRELKLPAGLDADKIEAQLTNGMLTVRLPKAEAARPRTITVTAG
jgi:HSP20 family protein